MRLQVPRAARAAATSCAATEDDKWFFDTELLLLAERAGLRIDEIPVDWIEDLGSTVHIVRTIVDDLAGMRRLHARVRAAPALGVKGSAP